MEWDERVVYGEWVVDVEEEQGIPGGVGMRSYHLSEARATS